MFKFDPAKVSGSNWNRRNQNNHARDDPTDVVQIYTESGASANGTLICANIPRSKLLQLLPALEGYLDDTSGNVLLPSAASAVDDDVLYDVILAVLAKSDRNGDFQLDVQGHPINYIQTHVVLVLLGMAKEARILEEQLWVLLRSHVMASHTMFWIWNTFGAAYELSYCPPHSAFYIQAMAWHILYKKSRGELDQWIDYFIFGDGGKEYVTLLLLRKVVLERNQKFGLDPGWPKRLGSIEATVAAFKDTPPVATAGHISAPPRSNQKAAQAGSGGNVFANPALSASKTPDTSQGKNFGVAYASGSNAGGASAQGKPAFGAANTGTTPISTFGPASGGSVFGAAKPFGSWPPPCTGTTYAFKAIQQTDEDGRVEQFQTLTFQPPYQSFSLEELRAEDYKQGRRYGEGKGNGQSGSGEPARGGLFMGPPPGQSLFSRMAVETGLSQASTAAQTTFGTGNTGGVFSGTNTAGGLGAANKANMFGTSTSSNAFGSNPTSSLLGGTNVANGPSTIQSSTLVGTATPQQSHQNGNTTVPAQRSGLNFGGTTFAAPSPTPAPTPTPSWMSNTPSKPFGAGLAPGFNSGTPATPANNFFGPSVASPSAFGSQANAAPSTPLAFGSQQTNSTSPAFTTANAGSTPFGFQSNGSSSTPTLNAGSPWGVNNATPTQASGADAGNNPFEFHGGAGARRKIAPKGRFGRR
jgi:hypothetical protein